MTAEEAQERVWILQDDGTWDGPDLDGADQQVVSISALRQEQERAREAEEGMRSATADWERMRVRVQELTEAIEAHRDSDITLTTESQMHANARLYAALKPKPPEGPLREGGDW